MAFRENRIGVVVTGVGLVAPLDWAEIASGRSALKHLTGLEAAGAKAAGPPYPITGLAWSAACTAMRDSGIYTGPRSYTIDERLDWDRVAMVVGLSKGDIQNLGAVNKLIQERSPKEYLIENAWRQCLPNASAIGIEPRFRGPRLAPIAACATGLVAAIQGADLIRLGVCDIALCGAADRSLNPLILGAFRNMKALATVDADPARAIRPWDKERSGFLIGEGAAILVLEREDHAKARGVLPYAEFAGGAFGSDAFHITNLNPDPTGLAHLIGLALKNAEASPSDLDYINVHGTATRQNDPLECRAIRKALGSHADSVSCSANKAQIGHLLGAAGAAELAITCLSIRDGFVPPTLNLDDPDPACDLDGTPHVGKYRDIRAAMKISIGFGGHIAAAVLRRPDGPRRMPILLNSAPNSA